MRLIRWIVGIVGGLSLAVGAIFVGGALVMLEWDREHSARTEALPLVSESGDNGLVRN